MSVPAFVVLMAALPAPQARELPRAVHRVQTVGRRAADVAVSSAVARRICEEEGVWIDDLHAVAAARLGEIQLRNSAHLSEAGSEVLREHAAMNTRFLLGAFK